MIQLHICSFVFLCYGQLSHIWYLEFCVLLGENCCPVAFDCNAVSLTARWPEFISTNATNWEPANTLIVIYYSFQQIENLQNTLNLLLFIVIYCYLFLRMQ